MSLSLETIDSSPRVTCLFQYSITSYIYKSDLGITFLLELNRGVKPMCNGCG